MAKDMKTCIKDFLKHVETLEGEEDPDGCGIHREYRLIHELQIKNRRENVFKSDVGKENLSKNRYKDIIPYDDHRVILKEKEDEEGSHYINASLIQGVKGSGGYIASQGPLASTVNDFWRMIWEKEVEIVFMACRIVELGKIKCKQYWNDVDESDEFGDIKVHTESEENLSSDFIKRVFSVTLGEDKRTVLHYHYSGWPDHGIPDDPAHIRDLIAIMRQARKKVNIPIVVHCSAGCGRTGAISAIDYVWTLLEEGKLDESFSLYELICKFREQRMSIVQTPDQYALVYRVLKSLCEDWLTKMASHTYINVELGDDYANVWEKEGNQEEHIYEDSVSLQNTVNGLTSSPSKPPSSPKDKVSSSDSNYVNVELSDAQPQQHSPSLDNNEKVLHKTVIQIGTAATSKKTAAPSPPSALSSTATSGSGSSHKEVVNLIQSDSAKPAPSRQTASLTKSLSVPPPSSSSSSSLGGGGGRGDTSTATASKKSLSLHNKPTEVPGNPPGFDERLPRVRGPVPMPPHWNQS